MANSTKLIIKALGFSPELLQNKISIIESLLKDLNDNIITSDDVSEQLEHMTKREMILNRQKKFCGIWLASDGRYKTKVPTADGGRRLIAKPTQEHLENYIVEHAYETVDDFLLQLVLCEDNPSKIGSHGARVTE